jgi:hypothetical protein
MRDYEIGYGKPPKHSQFKKGLCPNPRGRPRRHGLSIGVFVRDVLSESTNIPSKGRTRRGSRLELVIHRHFVAALSGDVASAAILLKLREQGLKYGDSGPLIINILNSPEPCPMNERVLAPKLQPRPDRL